MTLVTDPSVVAAQNPDAAAPPSATAPPQAAPPSADPSTPPPSATAPASALPRNGGLMHNILVGALAGAVKSGRAAQKVGQGIKQGASNFAANSPRGQELQNNALARQAKQQEMQQAQQKAQQDQAAALDDATIKKLQIQNWNMRNFADLHNQFKADEAEDAPFADFLQQNYPDQIQSFKKNELNSSAARHFGPNGQQNVAVSNGETGDDAGVISAGERFLQNTTLSKDFAIPSVNWKIDQQTGEAVPTDPQPSTLSAGNHTLWDAYSLSQTSKMNKAQAEADFDATQKRAKSAADVKNAQQGGPNPDSRPPDAKTSDTFINTVLPGYKDIDPSEINGLKAEAQNAKTTRDLEKVQDRALALQQAGVNKKLTEANTKAVKDASLDAANSKAANEDMFKIWSDPQHGFAQFGAQANAWKSDIALSKNGNQLASNLEPVMAALGVSSFAGVHRINPTEVQNAGPEVGSLYRRFNALLDKTGKGQLPTDTLNEAGGLIDALVNARYTSAVRATQLIAGNYKVDPNSLMVTDMDGNPVSLGDATQILSAKQKGNPNPPKGPASQTGKTNPQPSKGLQNLQFNPQTKQTIGWNGSAWVDAKTGQPVTGQQ
jgi:hypothetical protein